MKDLPHHMKKLNRRVIRSERRAEMEQGETWAGEGWSMPPRKQTERELKKQAKAKIRKEKENHIPQIPSAEERNWKMKHRVPIFDRLSSQRPKNAKATRKKTPPL